MKKKVVDKVTKMNALLAEFHHICKSGIYSDTWPGWPDLLNDLYRTNKIFLKAYHSVSTTPDHARHDQMKCLLRLFTFLLSFAQFSHPGLVCCFLFLTLEYFLVVLLRFARPST